MNRIREVRKKKGISQEVIGDALGMGQSGVSKLEREITPITLEQMRIIANVLGCRVGDLEDTPEFSSDVYDAALFMQEMTGDTRASLIRVVRNISKLGQADLVRLEAIASALLDVPSVLKSQPEDEPDTPPILQGRQ